jgi:hypothetical protein
MMGSLKVELKLIASYQGYFSITDVEVAENHGLAGSVIV